MLIFDVIRALLNINVVRRQTAAFALLFAVLLIAAAMVGSDQVEANRISAPVDLGLGSMTPQRFVPSIPAAGNVDAADWTVNAHANPGGMSWRNQIVRRGDNLSLIFARAGVQATDLHLLLDTTTESKSLRSIFPGQTISFLLGDDGQLVSMRHEKSPLESVVFNREGSDFEAKDVTRTPEIRHAFRHAVLKTSLFDAGEQAGMSGRLLMELATIFGGAIDFVLDPKAGDSFSVLFEEKYLDGEKIGEGSIVAAQYLNADRHFSAFQYTDSNGDSGYFSEDGVSMRKAFLRAPLDFTRVSSNFNMRRLHPIARVIRPHRGVDYSAPTGTPVYASGDGKVVTSGYSRSNGNYVFIQHGDQFMTRYLHLHKRNVSNGQRVKQGQTIGTVGSTGLATGPHLHYEFLVKGVQRNPRTVLDNLPRVASLAGNELQGFHRSIATFGAQLANYTSAWEVAVASSNDQD